MTSCYEKKILVKCIKLIRAYKGKNKILMQHAHK